MPASQGPRLVYDAASAAGSKEPPPSPHSPLRGRVLRIAVALLLVGALAGAAIEARRAAALEARVAALTESLAAARAEIAARRQHLDAIRASVAEVRDRVGALESLAGADPSPAAPAAPAEGPPAR